MNQLVGNGIELNNSAGLLLTRTTTITGNITLTNGILTVASGQNLWCNNPLATVIGSSTAFINGQLKRTISSTGNFNFPVGITGLYAPATIATTGLNGTLELTAGFSSTPVSNQPSLTIAGNAVNNVISGGSWLINANTQPTSGSYGVTLSAPVGTSNGTAYYVIKRADNNSFYNWENQGTNAASSVAAGIVTASATGLTSFSQFAIAFTTTVLPVNLTSFTAKVNGTTSQLNWATATEINNKGFNVQHSVNGITYNNLGFVNGNGTSTQNNSYAFTHFSPISGNNYYRLQQVDNDGKFAYSPAQLVNFNQLQTALTVYPNPVISTINFNKNFAAGTTLQIVNSMGQVVESTLFSGNRYQLKTQLKGMYKVIVIEAHTNHFTTNILAQ